MLDKLIETVAKAVLTEAITHLAPVSRLSEWLGGDAAELAYQKSLARAYTAFARQYPELTASLFNKSFLADEVAPELAKLLTRHEKPDPAHLASLWAESIVAQVGDWRPRVDRRRKAAVRPATDFLGWLEAELKAEEAFQPLFDSRALESLPAIESNLDKLTSQLEKALAVASNYEQTVVKRSGGIDFHGDATVHGSVAGRDVNIYNSYFSGRFASLSDYYIPPDAVYQRVKVEDFVGREWLTAKVDAFLNDEQRKSGVGAQILPFAFDFAELPAPDPDCLSLRICNHQSADLRSRCQRPRCEILQPVGPTEGQDP